MLFRISSLVCLIPPKSAAAFTLDSVLDDSADDVFDDFFGGLVIEDDNVAIDVKQGESICQKTKFSVQQC